MRIAAAGPASSIILGLAGCTQATVEQHAAGTAVVQSLDAPAHEAIVAAHPLAADAGMEMLRHGGAPIDAAIAAQMVLGLVEPQSSGIGGGSLLMTWDAGSHELKSFDGLASAPSHATRSLVLEPDGRRIDEKELRTGPRTVGVPGTLAVLKQVHDRSGKLPWADLFQPAIRLAETGFPMPPYLNRLLSGDRAAEEYPEMVPLYFGPDHKVLPVGTMVRNPAYAQTLRRIARLGPDGLYAEGGEKALLAALKAGPHPSFITAEDLHAYRPVEREPVCGPFLGYRVCSFGPPSFGGIGVLGILRMVEDRAGGKFDFGQPGFAHLYLEAGRLADADRRTYVGDPDKVKVPVAGLLDPAYLDKRAAGIDDKKAAASVDAGRPAGADKWTVEDAGELGPMTSQLAVIDKDGDVLSMTTTVNLNFGARMMVEGYVLNDALTNFAVLSRHNKGHAANEMAGGKRPVTSMAPTIVFDAAGKPVLAGGAAGGGPIVDYVASGLIRILGDHETPATALVAGHLSSAVPDKAELEKGTPAADLAPALSGIGHQVSVVPLVSGAAFLLRKGDAGWIGAADPRRDGTVRGD